MKRRIILLMLMTTLSAATADRDMDGVSDERDQCKNTPFWAIVNSKGCTIKRIRHRKPTSQNRHS
jgi:hypothetical protein